MTAVKKLEDLGNFVLQYWQLLVPLFLGLSLAFQVGYFFVPMGLSFYHVSLEDLSKTGLIVSLGFCVAYGFSPAFIALEQTSRLWTKLLLLFVFSSVFIAREVWSLIQGVAEEGSIVRSSAAAFLTFKLLVLSILLGGLLVWKKRVTLLGFDSVALGYLLLAAAAFSYGVNQFYVDIRSTTLLQTKITSSSQAKLLVTERSYFYLLLDLNECDFVVEQKSNANVVRYIHTTPDEQHLNRIAYCMRGR